MIPKLKTTIPIQVQVKKENNKSFLVTNQNGNNHNNKYDKKSAICNSNNNKLIESLTNSNITSTTTTTTTATSCITSVNPSPSVKYHQVPSSSVVNKNLHNLSPIKPSFVNIKEEHATQQIMHSTPTHKLAKTIENFPLNQEKLKKYTSLVSEKDKTLKVSKKQKIVKELAINILELNGYRTRTEQLENQLKANYEHIKQNKSFRSSEDHQSITEKTDGIQNELGKLKSEMLEKIRDIHNLEEELVKIEGQNNSTVKQITSNFDLNGSSMLAHRSEEVMNEIKNVLKGMVNMENSINTIGDSTATTHNMMHTNNNSNSTFTQIYEEYHKIASSRSPSTSINIRTINTNNFNPKDQLDIYQRIEKFKNQIEQNYNYILIQSNKLESYFVKSENVEKCLNELENFKNVIESTQETLDREKLKLFNEIDNCISNPSITRNIRNEIEHGITNKYKTYHDIIRNLYSFIPIISSPNQTNLINKKDSDSSFLTEEEEAIKKISERIKVLKDRINQKQNLPKLSKKVRSKSSKNLNNSSSEDTDTKELLHLNEQIKLLKSRMIAKGNQLNKVKKNTNTNTNYHDETFSKPNQSICSSTFVQQQAACSGPIYLPISHIKKRNADSSCSPDNKIKYEIEPYSANQSLHENEITVSKKTTDIYKCSPERKYMSSIEIPADQLEKLKRNAQKKIISNAKLEPVIRSKSMYTKIINPHNIKKNVIEEKHKRNKSANNVRFENQSTENSEYEVNKKSNVTKHHPAEKETMTDNTQLINETFPAQEEIADLRQSLDKSHKEIIDLKSELNKKNDFFNKQLEEYKNKADLNSNEIQVNNKNNENLLKLIENQNMEILELKQKLNAELIIKNEKIKNSEKLTESLDMDYAMNNGNAKKLNKIGQGSTDSLAIKKTNDRNSLQNVNINKTYLIDACIQTNDLNEINRVATKESEIPVKNLAEEPEVLMCNIPEHHSLEDIIHRNREEILNLKANLRTNATAHNVDTSFTNNRIYFDEIALLEKKAEFQALDLAINDKRKQLYTLELKRNRHINDSSINYNECSYSYLQDEISCIEQTLRKRIKEFNELEANLHNGRKELMIIKDSKIKLEKEFEYLKKKTNNLSKETSMFDKKANEATIELIATREELESLKKQRECLKNDIDSMKTELLNYVRSLKTTANDINKKNKLSIGDAEKNELKQMINEQRSLLESLNEEIYVKKKDIDLLREQSANLNKQLKYQVQTFDKEIAQIKLKKEEVNKEFSQAKLRLEQMNDDLKTKSKQIQEKLDEIDAIEKSVVELNVKKQDSEKKLKSIENELIDRKNELDNLDESANRYNQTLSQLRRNESEFVNELDKLNRELQNRKNQLDETKQYNEEMSSKRMQAQEKIKSLNEEIQNLSNDHEKKEKELNKLNNAIKEKQLTLRREKDELNEINDEKNYIMQEIQEMKEKMRNNKQDIDKLEENKISLENKIKSIQNELKQLNQQYFEQQQKYDQTDDLIRQQEIKLNENNQKLANQQSLYEQIIYKCTEEKSELENVTSYLNELKNEAQQEKIQLNNLKNQCSSQKKVLEDLNYRYEELQIEFEKKEENESENQELKNKLDFKIKQVNDLENKLAAKYQELEYMKDNFIELEKNIQEQISHSIKQQQQSYHIDLSEIKSNHFSIEDLMSQCGTNKSSSVSNNNNLQPKSLISSLLFTPKIKKSASSFQTTTTIMDDLSSINTQLKSGLAYYQSPESAFSEEHSEFKERITKNFEENLSHLEKTKIQTKNLIENLKYSLNEIENLTANNVFKLTTNLNI